MVEQIMGFIRVNITSDDKVGQQENYMILDIRQNHLFLIWKPLYQTKYQCHILSQ